MNLLDLFRQASATPGGQAVHGEMWALIEAAGLRRWRKGDAIPCVRRRILIGVVMWSRYELEFVQELVDHISAVTRTGIVTELFDMDDVVDMADFENYIPGIGKVYGPPAVGLWEDGAVVRTAAGPRARQVVREILLNH